MTEHEARRQLLLTRIALERVELQGALARLRSAARAPVLAQALAQSLSQVVTQTLTQTLATSNWRQLLKGLLGATAAAPGASVWRAALDAVWNAGLGLVLGTPPGRRGAADGSAVGIDLPALARRLQWLLAAASLVLPRRPRLRRVLFCLGLGTAAWSAWRARQRPRRP